MFGTGLGVITTGTELCPASSLLAVGVKILWLCDHQSKFFYPLLCFDNPRP